MEHHDARRPPARPRWRSCLSGKRRGTSVEPRGVRCLSDQMSGRGKSSHFQIHRGKINPSRPRARVSDWVCSSEERQQKFAIAVSPNVNNPVLCSNATFNLVPRERDEVHASSNQKQQHALASGSSLVAQQIDAETTLSRAEGALPPKMFNRGTEKRRAVPEILVVQTKQHHGVTECGVGSGKYCKPRPRIPESTLLNGVSARRSNVVSAKQPPPRRS